MTTPGRKVQQRVTDLAEPIVKDIGLELVDVEYCRHGGSQVLRIYLERDGGVTVDDLQEASRSLEKALEVEEILSGRFRLEVSSPGIDRPLKQPRDFQKRAGERIRLKTFDPLPDGRRRLSGTLVSAGEDEIRLETDEGDRMVIPYRDISSAGPEIDWQALLKKPPSLTVPPKKGARRTS